MSLQLQDIRSLTLPELQEVVAAMGQPSYRAKQIFHWLQAVGVTSLKR